MPPKNAQQPKGKGNNQSSHTDPSSSSASAAKASPWIQPKTIIHPEHHHTLNHLNQVAAFYSVVSTTTPSPSPSTLSSQCHGSRDTALNLQSDFVRAGKTLSRKAVIRLDTGVKRSSCPKCEMVWIEGLTVDVRARRSGPHGHLVKKRCKVVGCAGGRRVPAPDLVPTIGGRDSGDGKKSDRKRIATEGGESERVEKGKKRMREDETADEKKKKRVAQRQRRRVGSKKKHLLRESIQQSSTSMADDTTTTPQQGNPDNGVSDAKAAVKLSRSQKRQQRLSRLATRSSTAPPPTASTLASTSTAINSAKSTDDSVGAESSDLSSKPTATATQKKVVNPTHPNSAPPQSTPRRRKAPKPSLPHFNDRVQDTHWDDGLSRLSSLLSTEEQEENVTTTQALYWQKAARSRGDHILVRGVGKNGSLGPNLP